MVLSEGKGKDFFYLQEDILAMTGDTFDCHNWWGVSMKDDTGM